MFVTSGALFNFYYIQSRTQGKSKSKGKTKVRSPQSFLSHYTLLRFTEWYGSVESVRSWYLIQRDGWTDMFVT